MSTDRDDLFAEAPCGYVELDADGVVIAANRSFLALVDRPEAEVVGTLPFVSLLPAGDRIYHETHFRPALQMQGAVHEIALELVRPDGDRVPALVSANLRTDGDTQTTRVIVFEARDRRRYEQELLRARRAAEVAEQRATTLAQTLQQTFIPPTLPEVPGLEIAGAYRPAGDGSEVGGDFYDVFQIRTGEWVVAVGDVCGKGVEAAVLTAFVRHSIRALAVQWDSPAEILRALNSALLTHGSDRFCTVVILRLIREDDRWLATVSSGGHPLPLLVATEGAVAEVGASGSLIGVLGTPQLDDGRGTIGPGDSLVLYTDGVTEARQEDEVFGIDRLMSLVARGVESAETTTATLLDEVLTFQDGKARDDIAIVAITVRQPGEDGLADGPAGAERPLDAEAKNRALLALQEAESSSD